MVLAGTLPTKRRKKPTPLRRTKARVVFLTQKLAEIVTVSEVEDHQEMIMIRTPQFQ